MVNTYYARVDIMYESGDKIFTIPFSYIKEGHIKVLINEIETQNFVFNTTSQIQINDDIIAGDLISIIRQTPLDDRIVKFTNTSILNKDNQNLSAQQTFNIVQEMYDSLWGNKEDTDNQIAQNKADTDAQIQANKEDTDNQIAQFENEINATIEEVLEAAEQINELEEAVESATTAANAAQISANAATEQAVIATEKANELTAALNLLNDTAEGLANEIMSREEADINIQTAYAAADSILQSQIDDLLFISKTISCEYLNFLKAGSTHTELKILPKTALRFTLGETDYFSKTNTEISFNVLDKLDTGSTLQAGKDYSVYITPIVTGYDFVVSLNSTFPTGYTADTTYKIGGFHTLCVGVTSTNAPSIPSNSWFTTHTAIGYNAGDIIPNSVWCLTHRPVSDPSGMVYVDLIHKWVDIYLQSGTFTSTASVYGATTTDSRQPILHQFDMICVGKSMATDNEFMIFAEGSNQKTAISGAKDWVTTGGHVDTANKRMISCYFVEDCCGFLWQWLDEIGFNGQINWTSYGSGAEDRGQTYGMPFVLLAGGGWDSSSFCGSWSRSCADTRSSVFARAGCRGVSRSLLIGKVA